MIRKFIIEVEVEADWDKYFKLLDGLKNWCRDRLNEGTISRYVFKEYVENRISIVDRGGS
mgnify:CR=1 FL=1